MTQTSRYVYLDRTANRLIISQSPVEKPGFRLLMNSSTDNYYAKAVQLENSCKMFCLGYIIGCGQVAPVNDPQEFA